MKIGTVKSLAQDGLHPGTQAKGHTKAAVHHEPRRSAEEPDADPESQIMEVGESCPPTAVPLSTARQVALVLVLSGASFINTVSHMSALILLPSIGRDLVIPQERQQLIVESYALTFACFLFLWGRLADVYGRRQVFLLGSCWITLFCVVSPWSPDEITFNVFRGLQGLGAAANVPTAMGIIGATFEPGRAKIYAISLYSAGFPLGSVFGSIFAGLIGNYAGWHYVYWTIGAITGIITIIGWFVIPVVPPANPGASIRYIVDWYGALLITLSLMMIMFSLTEGNVVGWSAGYIPTLIIAGFAGMGCFVCWQLHLEKGHKVRPLMKISLWKSKSFAAAQIINALIFAAFTTFLVYATFFYQDYLGLSVIETTVRFIPTGVVGLFAVTVFSQLIARIDGFYITICGCLFTGIACLLFAVPIPTDTIYWAYGFPAMCLSTLGVDTVYPLVALYTIQCVPSEDQAMGGSIVSAVGQLGRAVGLAIATALQVAVERKESKGDAQGTRPAQLTSYRAVEWLSFGFCIFCVVVAAYAFRGAGKVGAKRV